LAGHRHRPGLAELAADRAVGHRQHRRLGRERGAVNSADRKFMHRVYVVLNEVGTLTPPNPANTRAIFENHPVVIKTVRDVNSAISSYMFRDTEVAEEYLDDADARLAEHRKKTE
jgi:hypothetical protein